MHKLSNRVDWSRPAILLVPRSLEDWEFREAQALLETAGYSIEAVIRYRRVSRSKLLSKAKLEEVREIASKIKNSGVLDTKIVVYDDIKPHDYMILVETTQSEVVDRTMLILEIFALHAGSKEAKLQIELARLKHQLPLIREAIRRAKMKELPGFLGPGGYAIDAYYRYTVSRIARIRKELEALRRRRMHERIKRRSAGLPHIAIVGYASAGKTSLFNALTGENKPVSPKYFTTVTPKVKAVELDHGIRAAFIDTVGFITNVPPELIEAFHATLEEIAHADIVLFVIDPLDPDTVIFRKLEEGIAILRRVGVVGKPIIPIINKADLLSVNELERKAKLVTTILTELYPVSMDALVMSAVEGTGLRELVWRVTILLKNTVKSMFSE